MRIAIFVEVSSDLGGLGGVFRQVHSMIDALARKGATKHEIVVFTPFEPTRQLFLAQGIEAISFKRAGFRLLDRWSATVVGGALLRRVRRFGLPRLGRHLDALLDEHHIDLVLLSNDGEAFLRIGDHPFVITLFDVAHRDYPDFADWYADREFERWEKPLQMTLTRALAVIAISPSIARRIASLYRVDPHRIIVLPLLPPMAARRHAAGQGLATVEGVRRKYNLPSRYVFYPAFFSFHKNHLYLLEGLAELERLHGIALHAVFCGSDPNGGVPAIVERQVQALGLTARVHFLGVVPDEEVPALYEAAMALAMPSYFGPANLPPLEAVTLGCPVILADLPGCREQMGDAALYCDLADPTSLARHLAVIAQDTEQCERLRQAGRKLAAEIAKIDYGEILAPVLDEYAYVRRRWAWPEKVKSQQ